MSEQTTMTAEEINRKLELLLFGDDLTAKTEEQIQSAVTAWFQTTNYVLTDIGISKFNLVWGESSKRIWQMRSGKPWQSELESFVAAYRRPPRNFTTPDGMMLVLKAMLEKRFHAIMHYTDNPSAHFSTGTPLPVTWHYEATLPLTVAVCAVAALAALEATDA